MNVSQTQTARVASHRTHGQGSQGRGSSRQGPCQAKPEGSRRVTPIHTQFPVASFSLKSLNFFASVLNFFHHKKSLFMPCRKRCVYHSLADGIFFCKSGKPRPEVRFLNCSYFLHPVMFHVKRRYSLGW